MNLSERRGVWGVQGTAGQPLIEVAVSRDGI